MKPEIGEHLNKARDCLSRAKIILAAGVGEDAGRNAYLAAFHAAQALIVFRRGKVSKTHRGVHLLFHELSVNEHELGDLARFLSRAYDLKAVADYELNPYAEVSFDQADEAIRTAEEFVKRIAALIA